MNIVLRGGFTENLLQVTSLSTHHTSGIFFSCGEIKNIKLLANLKRIVGLMFTDRPEIFV